LKFSAVLINILPTLLHNQYDHRKVRAGLATSTNYWPKLQKLRVVWNTNILVWTFAKR